MNQNRDPQLFVDGKSFFPALLRTVDQAEKSIFINMFIWRDDEIGNALAHALLRAMDRGVRVEISKDRYGVVLELAEEGQSSFFHKKPTLSERAKAAVLRRLYHHGKKLHPKTRDETLYARFIHHPNLSLDCERFKADHSKYYIIDGKALFLGGINVEDKENGLDREGRLYQDYMVGVYGEEKVRDFLSQLQAEPKTEKALFYGYNDNTDKKRFFMEALYLDVIQSAERELHITMAYFSPCKRFIKAIRAAEERGVRISILVPERANFQSDTNLKTVKRLLRRSHGGVSVYLSPKMVHTKLIKSEKMISLGSTNITKKAFSQLSELNLFLKNGDDELASSLVGAMKENYALSKKVNDPKYIKYNPLKAFFEGFLV